MNSRPAKVVALDGSDAWVETGGTGAERAECAGCMEGAGCVSASAVPGRFLVRNDIDARIGEHVDVVAAPGMVWRAVTVSYILPLGLGCGFAALGQWWAGDGPAVAALLTGVTAGWLLMRFAGRRLGHAGALVFLRRRPIVITEIKESP